jgi:hypothetical protein
MLLRERVRVRGRSNGCFSLLPLADLRREAGFFHFLPQVRELRRRLARRRSSFAGHESIPEVLEMAFVVFFAALRLCAKPPNQKAITNVYPGQGSFKMRFRPRPAGFVRNRIVDDFLPLVA